MSAKYTCDVCNKQIKNPTMFTFGINSPFRHLCEKCWKSTVKYLKKKANKLTKKS